MARRKAVPSGWVRNESVVSTKRSGCSKGQMPALVEGDETGLLEEADAFRGALMARARILTSPQQERRRLDISEPLAHAIRTSRLDIQHGGEENFCRTRRPSRA